ncbi:MAG: hypothetical protein ACR2FH_03625, partial [Caulobacteraceae bacterium]
WLTGPCEAADAFARTIVKFQRIIIGSLPNCANPDRPILGGHAPFQTKLAAVETLVAGYAAAGADYVNFHWYEPDPIAMGQAVAYLQQASGLPAMSNEVGEHSLSGDTVVNLLAESIALDLPYVIWHGSDGSHHFGLTNSAGVLRANGWAFKAYTSTHK